MSVIVPAYNAQRFLGRAMRSALAQTYRHLELIVVDDGSTDDTACVIRSFQDGRVRHLAQPNRGQGAARNAGIRASTGQYVTFLDADDVYLPEKVGRQVEFLETHRDRQVVFCYALHAYGGRPAQLFERPVERITFRHGDDILRGLVRIQFINTNTIMVAGDALRSGFLFREERYYPEEWDLYLRLACAGFRFEYLDAPLVIREIRDDSNTTLAIQGYLKRYTLEMFEALFAGMTPEERAACGADGVLRSCRMKLAGSTFVSADPAGALNVVAAELPPVLTAVLHGVLRIVPASVVRASAGYLWRARQRRSYVRVRNPALEAAWAGIREQVG